MTGFYKKLTGEPHSFDRHHDRDLARHEFPTRNFVHIYSISYALG
jgi:hypothetical protein